MRELIRKKRGRLTYFTEEGNQLLSTLVTEDLDNNDLRIYFSGVTGIGAESKGPEAEIPACFERFEKALREAGICDSLAEVDFLEIRVFGTAPKGPNPIVDPEGYANAKAWMRKAYAKAYAEYWAVKLPNNCLPTRFTVYLEDLPNPKASFELAGTALLQRTS